MQDSALTTKQQTPYHNVFSQVQQRSRRGHAREEQATTFITTSPARAAGLQRSSTSVAWGVGCRRAVSSLHQFSQQRFIGYAFVGAIASVGPKTRAAAATISPFVPRPQYIAFDKDTSVNVHEFSQRGSVGVT